MALPADRYVPLEVTGSGGMATVWRARDTLLDRIVAMKRPHPAPPDSDVYARFERESRMAATVSHPNLVTVYDVGTDDTGPYLIMEFIDAPSLAATSVGSDDVAVIGSQIAAGVAALHAVGVVHRDIKPANVLMAPGGAKLTDFGIARSLESGDSLTRAGVVHATPAYAAPEVIAGGEYSPEADVYSLGAILLELVTGEPANSRRGTRLMVTDPGWAQILGPAMSNNPADRPSAADLAIQLETLRMGSGAAVLPPTTRLPVGDLPKTAAAAAAGSAAAGSAPHSLAQQPAETARYRSRGMVWAFAALIGVMLAVIAVSARRPIDMAGPASTEPAATLPLEVAVPTESAAPDVTPQDTAVTQTVAAELSSTATARDEFVDFLQGLPQDEIKPKEVRDLVKQSDDAIAAASHGETDKAISKLTEVAGGVDKHISSDADREVAFGLLAALSSSLGFDLDVILDEQA